MNSTSRFLTTDDVAYALGITRPTVIKYIRGNRLEAIRSGKAYKITPEALVSFANKTGMNDNPLKTLVMRNGKSKKTVVLGQHPREDISPPENILPIKENRDALYFLSIWLSNAQNELIFRVRESFLVIGRDTLAAISIQDPCVSNIHAVLTYQKGSVVLKDQSTNGTIVSNAHLKYGETAILGDNSEFIVGNSALKILSPHRMDQHFNSKI
ncbi:MAG: FHA domain-containing protein [Desulfobacteraceae bacterium]|nr:FHA domain-containing protein [Desulfobacteraceae bacterium]